ncbi:MAG TPA: DUF2142 domain-containing protein [Microbacterium sp.]|nr:DUF2142 domain-containing protein [Microbacterium sp.]
MAEGLARLGSSRTWTFLALWAATAALGLAWAISTPMVASPDEPAHIFKAAAVVLGEWMGEPTEQPGFTEVRVPSGVATAWSLTCTAYDESVPASCQGSFPSGSELLAVQTSAGLYNPTYYALVGWPSLLTDDPRVAIYAMRALTAVLCGFFFAIAGTTLLSSAGPLAGLVAYLAILTPTTVFLAGSVNPNAFEVSAAAALLAVLLALVRRADAEIPGSQLILVAISGVALANARGLSLLWMAVIAVIVIIAARSGRMGVLLRSWRVWITLAVLAVGVGLAGLWVLVSNSLGNMGTFAGAGTVSPGQAFFVMLLERSTDEGLVALFGWLETAGPPIAFALWGFLALAIVFGAFVVARGRLVWATLAAVAAFFLVPAGVQAASVEASGYIWQGRYSLAIYAVVIVVAAIAGTSIHRAKPTFSSLRAILVIGLSVAAISAFTVLWVIRRYALGADGWWGDLITAPQWLPPLGWWPWPLLALSAAAAVVLVAVAAERHRRAGVPGPDSDDVRTIRPDA